MLLESSTSDAKSSISEEQQQTRFKVISILASQSSDIANLVLQSLSPQITEGLLAWNDPAQINSRLAIRWATFWINCISD
jgi:hypothetical protein